MSAGGGTDEGEAGPAPEAPVGVVTPVVDAVMGVAYC